MSRSEPVPLPRLSHAEVIARVQRACDGLVARVTRHHQPPVSCRTGCDHCCKQPVFITPLEGIAIRDFLEAAGRTEEVRRETRRYLSQIRQRPQGEAALRALHKNIVGEGPPPSVQQRHAVYGPPCIFLKNGLCSIYPVRPLMCREHISFDDPGKCERDEPFLGLEKPRFSEVSAYLTHGAVKPRDQMRPVWEYESAAEAAESAPQIRAGDLKKVIRWKTGP